MSFRFKGITQIVLSFLCVLTILAPSISSFASDIAEVEGQTSDLQYQLANIDQELLDLSDEIYATETLIEQTNGAIIRAEISLADAQSERNDQQDTMAKRIRFIYEGGSLSLLEMLFTAESIIDFINKAEFIQAMGEYDRDMLIALQEIVDSVEQHQDDLIFQQNALYDIKADLEAKQEELEGLANETATDLDYFLGLLDQLRVEEALRQQAEAERIAAEIAAAAPPPATNTNDAGSGNSGGNAGGGGGGNSGGGMGNQPPMSADADDITLFAALLEAEAFQNYEYLLAVATVILSRVADPRFPGTLRGVIFQPGQFGPVTNGSLDRILARGPTALSIRVATDALNGARSSQLTSAHVFFNHAGASSQPGINIGGNIFWTFWPAW